MMKRETAEGPVRSGKERAPARVSLPDRGRPKILNARAPRRSVLADNTAGSQQPRGRPFKKGESGNPAGRPKGTRNRASAMLETIAEDDLWAIVSDCRVDSPHVYNLYNFEKVSIMPRALLSLPFD